MVSLGGVKRARRGALHCKRTGLGFVLVSHALSAPAFRRKNDWHVLHSYLLFSIAAYQPAALLLRGSGPARTAHGVCTKHVAAWPCAAMGSAWGGGSWL